MIVLRPFVRLVFLAGLAASAVAVVCASCSDGSVAPDDDASTAEDGSGVSPAMCPPAVPEQGATCTLPEGTTCAFGVCASYAVCTRGTWNVPPTPRPRRLCPSLVPDEGAACGDCFEDGGTCTYGDPTCADASTNAALASCRRGKFSISIVTCVEAGLEAGPRDGGVGDGADAGDARD